jgi:ankyrin repeat protein
LKKGIGQDQFDLRKRSTQEQMVQEAQRFQKDHGPSDITPLRGFLFSLLGIGCLAVTLAFGNYVWGQSANSRVTSAAKEGSLAQVKALVATTPALLNVHGYLGRTPLHWAAIKGQDAVVDYLLTSGADVNAKDASGGTPLHAAALNGKLKAVERLVAGKVTIAAADSDSRTALFSAAAGGNTEMAAYLLSLRAPAPKGKDAPEGALYLPINSKDAAGLTPLHIAVLHRKLAMVSYLLGNGAEVNAKDNSGATPLHLANQLKRGDDIVDALVTAGGSE